MKHEFRVKMEWPIFCAYATVPNANASPEDKARLARQLLDNEVRAAFPNFPALEYDIDGTE